MTTKVAVAGASGYAGGEILRLLLGHPGVQSFGERTDGTGPDHRGVGLVQDGPHRPDRRIAAPPGVKLVAGRE